MLGINLDTIRFANPEFLWLLIAPGVLPGPLDSLLGQPAVGSVPAAFATMIVVSLFTRSAVTPRADAVLATLHLPTAARRAAGGSQPQSDHPDH